MIELVKKYKKLLIVLCLVLISALGGLMVIITPKYLHVKQIERDDTTKCKSYRALENIAATMYRNDPDGSEWLSKSKEAEIRRNQHKCSQIIVK